MQTLPFSEHGRGDVKRGSRNRKRMMGVLFMPHHVVWEGMHEFLCQSQVAITKAFMVLLVFHPKVLPAGGRTAARAEPWKESSQNWTFCNREVSSGETPRVLQGTQWGVHLRTVTWTPSIKRASISLQSKSRKWWLSLEGEVHLWFVLVLLPHHPHWRAQPSKDRGRHPSLCYP